MRYPKHPFSPTAGCRRARRVAGRPLRGGAPDTDESPDAVRRHTGGGAGPWQRYPPLLPRHTGDSGFRPDEQPGPAAPDSWQAADPQGSWPLAPRPQAEPQDSWAHEDPQLAWAAVPPQDETQDSLVPVVPQEAERAWPPSAPADEPQEPWAEGNYRQAWPTDAPVADEPPERPVAGDRQQAWSDGTSPSDGARIRRLTRTRGTTGCLRRRRRQRPGSRGTTGIGGDSWPAEVAGQGNSGEPWVTPARREPRRRRLRHGERPRSPGRTAILKARGTRPSLSRTGRPLPQRRLTRTPAGPAPPGAQQDWAPAPPAQADPPWEAWRPPERPPVGRTSPGCRPRRRPDGGCVAGSGATRPDTGASRRSPSPQRPSHGPIGWRPGARFSRARGRARYGVDGFPGSAGILGAAARPYWLRFERVGGPRPPIRNSYGTRNTRTIYGRSRPPGGGWVRGQRAAARGAARAKPPAAAPRRRRIPGCGRRAGHRGRGTDRHAGGQDAGAPP